MEGKSALRWRLVCGQSIQMDALDRAMSIQNTRASSEALVS